MKVSVVVPCYKQARFLDDCITSLQEQSHSNWEAIIVNDGSPDDTEQVAQRLCSADPRVRCVSKPNGGLSSARNAGLAVAQGCAVQFLDADDLLEPGKLSKQVAVLSSNPDIGVVYGSATYFRDADPERRPMLNAFIEGGEQRDWIAERAEAPGSVFAKFLQHNLYPVCAPLVRRQVLGDPPYFNEQMAALEDWEFWTRLAAAQVRFEYAPASGAACLVRVHGGSMTHDKGRMLGALKGLRKQQLRLSSSLEDRVFLLGLLMSYLKDETREQFEHCVKHELRADLRGSERLAVWLSRLASQRPALYAAMTLGGRALPWRLRAIADSARETHRGHLGTF
jgi:GT2 family glycosyltransferase